MNIFLVGSKVQIMYVNSFSIYSRKDVNQDDIRKALPQTKNGEYFVFTSIEDAQECVARMRYLEQMYSPVKDASKGDLFSEYPIFCISTSQNLSLTKSKDIEFRKQVCAHHGGNGKALYITDTFNRYSQRDSQRREIEFHTVKKSDIQVEPDFAYLGSKEYDLTVEVKNACVIL